MARGIEKTLIFRTVEDRADFLRRLVSQVEPTGAQVLAWALLPNHLHLLLRTGHRPLASPMRRLLTGYASGPAKPSLTTFPSPIRPACGQEVFA